MVIEAFPPVSEADEYGLLAVGGDLEVQSLLLAYRSGIFPWPLNSKTLTWFAPPERAILQLKEFHCSQSLKRAIRKTELRFTINRDFAAVIKHCAETVNRPGQKGTWITKDVLRAYSILHDAGFAHSFECYEREELVAGVYGVSLGGMFAAESMFYRRPNASKMTLQFLVKYLEIQEVPWIDAQVQNPFLQTLGFKEVARARFMKLLERQLSLPPLKFPRPHSPAEAVKLEI